MLRGCVNLRNDRRNTLEEVSPLFVLIVMLLGEIIGGWGKAVLLGVVIGGWGMDVLVDSPLWVEGL